MRFYDGVISEQPKSAKTLAPVPPAKSLNLPRPGMVGPLGIDTGCGGEVIALGEATEETEKNG